MMKMSARSLHCLALALLLVSRVANAQTVTLNLSFARSDLSTIYLCRMKPFVDAVNREGADRVKVEVHFGRLPVRELKLVLDGTIDIASILTADSPERFPDRAVFELPGLFRDQTEASLVFTRLVEAGVLRGYKDIVVLGALVSAGETIHSRKPTSTLADLRGQTIRVNNDSEVATLKKLGAIPLLLPINQTMDSLGQGKIDGVTVPADFLFEFGFGRLTVYHYLLRLGGVPGILVLNRAKFESLPTNIQAIIRKYSGSWLAAQNAACLESKDKETMALLQADPRRKVVEPSQADQAAADRVFAEVTEEWAAQSPRNRELLKLVKDEIAKVRAGK